MKRALAVLCLVPALAWAAEKTEKPKAKPIVPGVDWTAMTIRATGRGAPALNAPSIAAARIGAERAAELDALRNVLATLKSVQLTAEKSVGEAMSGSDSIKATVEGAARGFKRVDTRYFSDGGVEIDVEMSIEGMVAQLLPPPPQAAPVAPASLEPATNTGLVVDAKGLPVKPALAPRLLDEAGKEVYSAAQVAPDAIRSGGIAGYQRSLDEASKSPRVGEKPMLIKALRASGSDLVIADADAQKLRGAKGAPAFLGQGRVIIVAD